LLLAASGNLAFGAMGFCGWCGPQLVLVVKNEYVFVEMLSAASKRVLWLLVRMASLCANPFIRLANVRRPRRLPRIANPLLLNSATKLAQMIRTQQVGTTYCNINPLLIKGVLEFFKLTPFLSF